MKHSQEIDIRPINGWFMLAVNLLLVAGGLIIIFYSVSHQPTPVEIIGGIILELLGIFSLIGHFAVQPNEAKVLLLLGKYKGTARTGGFYWTHPFYTKNMMSLRARTLITEKMKVNDLQGNPIEIAAVVVWRVLDTAQASFDVENYLGYVGMQSESALRHLANSYAYDNGEANEITLRSGTESVAAALKKELEERLSKAGVGVVEARIAHLAYAPEIAQAMLRRQQAEAVIAARQKIVHGAVSMVDMALKELTAKQVVNLDDERKAAMVSNLLVVLCGEAEVTPVVNTGTLYN
ncbi:MAG: band 7 protein [Verrucomicrobiales bacterium]|nr:band 7 protein [Verrucomicrobiales bacterium]MDB6130829.1 band 7 protein [Verrucomicrobiales bacterium]